MRRRATEIEVVCEHCGATFTANRRTRLYCSRRCKTHGVAAKKPARTCAHCGEDFHPLKPTSKYCSMTCRAQATQHIRVAAAQEALRGTGDGRSYPKLNGRHEHRVVAEQMLGRPLAPGEVVHHKDETKTNNDPSNLVVFPSQAEHARHHALLKQRQKGQE